MVAPVYDKEKVEDTDGPVVGKNSADKYAEEPKALDAEQLRNAETAGTDKSGSVQEEGEEADFIYRDEGKKGTGKKRITKRKKLLGVGATGGIVGIVFFIFTIASGPLQFIHFAQLLQKFHFSNNEEFMDGRTGRYMRHLLRGGSTGDASRSTRLSLLGNKFADSAELKLQNKSGLKTVYNRTTGRVNGYEIIDRNKASAFLGDMDLDTFDLDTADPTRSDFGAKTINMVSPDGKPITGAVITMKGDDIGTRRKFTRAIVKGASASKIAGSLSSRLLIKRGGVTFHPLNKLKIVDEKYADWRAKRKKERADADRNGSVTPDDALDGKNPDSDGDGKPDNDSVDGEKAKTEAQTAKTEAQTGTDTDAAKVKTKASIKTKLLGGAAAFIGILCTVREINNSVEKLQYANIIMPLMRIGFRVVATGNQVMSGNDVSLDELRVLNEDMYDAEKKLGWSSARSIQAELGEEQTGPDIPATAKPSRVGGNPFSQAIDTLFSKIGVAGSAVCSTVGNIILTVGEFTVAIATGGITEVVIQVAKAGVMIGASAAGVNPVDMFTEWLVDTMAGKPVNVDAKGPDLGNIANYGARLAANDQAIASGGAKLSAEDVALLDTQTKANQNLDMQQKSFFARVLDINEPSSVASKAMFENKNLASTQAMFSSLMRLPLTLLPNMANMFSRLFTPSVYAASNNYDYGFDEFGFSQADQDNPLVDDPFENAVIVEPRLAELNKKYGKCFSTTINPTTFVVESGKTVNFLDLDHSDHEDCRDGSDILLRYRFYIADTLTGNAMACYEVEDAESCGNVGFGEGNTSGVATSSTATGQIDVSALGESSASIACAVDTTDKGVIQSKYEGEFRKSNPLMIRLCQIPNLPGEGVDSTGTKVGGGAIVNSRVSAAWSELAKAAKAAGVSLTASSSFRLNNSCGGTGDGTACAQPGKSPHQLGVAIDFQNMGEKGGSSTSCTGRKTAVGNAGWDWLSKNAERFGLKQYSYEPWHWDPMPLANRCGTI